MKACSLWGQSYRRKAIGHEIDLAIKGNVLIVEGRLLDSKTRTLEDSIDYYKTVKRQYE